MDVAVSNRVLRNGAFKAPPVRNVEMTGPYFHSGSFLTLRQVVDFYFEGGDFPVTNAHSRDPHVVNLEMQAFAFGRPTGADLGPISHVFSSEPDRHSRWRATSPMRSRIRSTCMTRCRTPTIR
jgi:hypothetical protein